MCDYPEFYSVRNPTARKDRKCQECGGTIAKGEKYTYIAGKWEGDFSTFVDCSKCEALRQYCVSEEFYPEDGSDPDCSAIFYGYLHGAVSAFPEIPLEMVPPALLKYRVKHTNHDIMTTLGITLDQYRALRDELYYVDQIVTLFEEHEEVDWSFFTEYNKDYDCVPKEWMFKNAEEVLEICKEFCNGNV
jgi:hypothetical protein